MCILTGSTHYSTLHFILSQLELEASLARFDVKVTSLIQSSLEVVPRNLHKVSESPPFSYIFSFVHNIIRRCDLF